MISAAHDPDLKLTPYWWEAAPLAQTEAADQQGGRADHGTEGLECQIPGYRLDLLAFELRVSLEVTASVETAVRFGLVSRAKQAARPLAAPSSPPGPTARSRARRRRPGTCRRPNAAPPPT